MSSLDEYRYSRGIEDTVQGEFNRAVRHLCELIDDYPHLWHYGDGYGGYVRHAIEDAFFEWNFPREPERDNSSSDGRKSRAPISRTKVIAVMRKSESKCVHCGSMDDLQIDHIIPHSRGGSDDLDNLQMLCQKCNASKGAKTMEEWLGGAP
jgi:5-methylcytosine-specific restriction endonuclease McrA